MDEQYLDEVIVKEQKKKRQEQVKQSLQDTSLWEDLLQEVSLGGDMLTVKLPKGLIPMSEEWIQRKYQFDPQPEIVYSNRDGSVNFTLSLLEVAVSGEELAYYVEQSMTGLRRYLPSIVFLEQGKEEVQGIAVCWFSYMSNSFDGFKLYNLVFYAAAEKTAVMTLSCRFEVHEMWDAMAKVCIKSLTGRAYHG